MQNGLVYYQDSKNIGDDIQTYAASLLVDNTVFCNRERLDKISENTRLLCNGWFLEDAKHWPPSEFVNPLFISFHISNKNKKLMTSRKAIEYYKRYEPIGCRDYHTVELLKSHKVKSYFSGCLTLTIPKYEGTRGKEIIFADILRTNYTKDYRKTIVNNIIPKKYKDKVTYISHFSDQLKRLDVNTRMTQAKQILHRYAKAKIVFTSLIHCALPCIALGTPVIFVDLGFNNSMAKRDRFNGIIDLFHVESNLNAPFMERNFIGKLGRGFRLYHFMKDKITPLEEDLFEFSEVATNHLNLAQKIKTTIHNYFNT